VGNPYQDDKHPTEVNKLMYLLLLVLVDQSFKHLCEPGCTDEEDFLEERHC